MTQAEIRLELPYPPTVNTYWRHVGNKVLISRDGRRYRADVLGTVLIANPPRPLLGRLSVVAELYPPDCRKRDLDNVWKALLDAMKHARVYEDDGQIDHLEIARCERRAGGLVVVVVSQLEDV